MRVLVTGHRGYIGSVLTTVLQHGHFDVVGLDSGLYESCHFGRVREPIPSFDMDLRELEFTDLLSFDAVVHLASLSDPALAELNGRWTHEINVEATTRLADCCKKAGVTRFLFASCCSLYDPNGMDVCDEATSVRPRTPYAASKYLAELELLKLADRGFAPVILRHGIVYGVSPHLRLDSVVNDLVASAVATGHVQMRSSGSAWRPFVHVEDVARTYARILLSKDEAVAGEVFNLVSREENHREIDVADEVLNLLPHGTRASARQPAAEPSYKVDGGKLERAFPNLVLRWTLPLGVRQLYNAMGRGGLTPNDWRSDRYRRADRLRALMERGELDDRCRRVQHPATAGT